MKRRIRIGMVFALAVSALALTALPLKFSIRTKTYSKDLCRLHGDYSMWPDFYNQTGWDGPTGALMSGKIYAFRIGDWLLDFTVVTDDSRG